MSYPADREPPAAARTDVVAATRAAVTAVDAGLSVVADRTTRLRERWITGPSPAPGHPDGLVARVQARVELEPPGDLATALGDVVTRLRQRGIDLAEPDTVDAHLRTTGRDRNGSEVTVDADPVTRWLALLVVTPPLPPPGTRSLLDLDAAFLDEVDPDGTRVRDVP